MPLSLIPMITDDSNLAPCSPATAGMIGSAMAVPVSVPVFTPAGLGLRIVGLFRVKDVRGDTWFVPVMRPRGIEQGSSFQRVYGRTQMTTARRTTAEEHGASPGVKIQAAAAELAILGFRPAVAVGLAAPTGPHYPAHRRMT